MSRWKIDQAGRRRQAVLFNVVLVAEVGEAKCSQFARRRYCAGTGNGLLDDFVARK
jgi:hypothetical protein